METETATGTPPLACPRCSGPMTSSTLTCELCGAVIHHRILVRGSPFRVKPIAQRIAVGHGLGPDAIESSDRGVVLSGTAAAVSALAVAAETAGYEAERLPPQVITRSGSRRRWIAGAALLLTLGGGLWLWSGRGDPPPAPAVAVTDADAGPPVDAAPLAAAPGAAVAPADASIRITGAGPAIEAEVVRDAVRSTVHIVAGRRSGAGILISNEGHVLTNAHVVGLEPEVRVTLHDGSALKGAVLAHRRNEDLAVVRFEPPTGALLRAMPVGQATRLGVGDTIFMVGSPMGHDFSVTRGYVAHTRRWLENKPCVQVDAPIDRGNSGGPLLDARGRLVGVTTFKNIEAEGVGYAQMIERATQGPDAILAPFLYERGISDAFAEVMKDARPGMLEKVTEEDEREEAREEVLAKTGVIVIYETALVPRRRIPPAEDPNDPLRPGDCPAHVPHRMIGYCYADLSVRVVAVTAKGKRPETRSVQLKVWTGMRLSQAGIAATDSGWRSHKMTDPEAVAILDDIGQALGLEVSVWSSSFLFESHRVADLLALPGRMPPRVGVAYGSRETAAVRIPVFEVPAEPRHRRKPSPRKSKARR